jgi:hypothetical protein
MWIIATCTASGVFRSRNGASIMPEESNSSLIKPRRPSSTIQA